MKFRVALALLLATALQALSCSDAALDILPPSAPPVLDNKLRVSGEVCTERPDDIVFPLRVLFLVDGSMSMVQTDPPDPVTGMTGRERAVRETVERLLGGGSEGVKVSLVRFSGVQQALTNSYDDDGSLISHFSDDLDFVLERLPQISMTDGTTNFVGAINEAYAQIRHELMNSPQESYALTSYQIIMLTDGIPDVQGEGSSWPRIYDSVASIIELGRMFRVGKIAYNTVLIATGNPTVDAYASELLGTMAQVGNGTFRSFATGGELNFIGLDLSSLRRVFTLRTLVAMNLNAMVIQDVVYADSDGDGLADFIELAIGTSPFDPDTDGDGCNDGLEYRLASSGLDPLDPNDCQCFVPDYCFDPDEDGLCYCGPDEPRGSCCVDTVGDGLCDCIDEVGDGRCDPSNYEDSDGDGLYDCEERYAGSSRLSPDSDGDGLMDIHELRFGTAPDLYDIDYDYDWDGVPNGVEVKTGSDPRFDSRGGRSRIAYRYRVMKGQERQSSSCFEFVIDNITLTEPFTREGASYFAGPLGKGYTGANRILVYAGEVPLADVTSYARFRVACVEASYRRAGNYRDPPAGEMRLRETDFHALIDFDPEQHCVRPGDQ